MSKRLQRLEDLEATVTTFQQHRRKAATALWEIEKEALYEARGYADVKTYGKEHLNLTKRHVSNLVKYGHVIEILDGEGNGTPQKEAHARHLYKLVDTEKEDDIPDIWEQAVDRHGRNGITMEKVYQARRDFYADGIEDKAEPDRSEVDLKVPTETAESLGLDGDDHRGRRIVSWNGYTQNDVQEIIENVDPAEVQDEKPPNFDGEPVLADRIWRPIMGEEKAGSLETDNPERIVFRPTQAPRLEEATRLTLDSPTTLTCPAVDLLSDDVPDALTRELLDRSSGTDWEPVLHSVYHEPWTDYDLPDEAWIGSSASRTSIEDVSDALGAADDTEKKWVLYDLDGDDKQDGLPELDYSPIDWIVIDSLTHTHLTYTQLHRLVQSADDNDVALAIRDSFETKLESTP